MTDKIARNYLFFGTDNFVLVTHLDDCCYAL